MFPFFVGSFLRKQIPLLSRPHSTKVTSHVLGAYLTPTPSTSGVGRSNLARKAPHFLAPTPGQILNSLDIIH